MVFLFCFVFFQFKPHSQSEGMNSILHNRKLIQGSEGNLRSSQIWKSQDLNPILSDFKTPLSYTQHCTKEATVGSSSYRNRWMWCHLLIPHIFSRAQVMFSAFLIILLLCCSYPPLQSFDVNSVNSSLPLSLPPSIHPLNKYSSTASFVSGTVLGAGDSVKIKPHKNLWSQGAYLWVHKWMSELTGNAIGEF